MCCWGRELREGVGGRKEFSRGSGFSPRGVGGMGCVAGMGGEKGGRVGVLNE